MKRKFYARDAAQVANELLGKVLVHQTPEGITKGMIVETEAYYGELDPASHAYGGKKTPRNEVMWGPPGYAYVYFTYGMHYMLNVVTGRDGEARAVLIRAVGPLEGIELMRKRRKTGKIRNRKKRFFPRQVGVRMTEGVSLTNGPARVTQAFGINKLQNGADMVNSNLRIVSRFIGIQKFKIVACPRVGVKDMQNLRFYIAGNPFVSKRI